MYQCSNCRRTFWQGTSRCPHCGASFAGTQQVKDLLPSWKEEAAAHERRRTWKKRVGRWGPFAGLLAFFSFSSVMAAGAILKADVLPDHRPLVTAVLGVMILVWIVGLLVLREGDSDSAHDAERGWHGFFRMIGSIYFVLALIFLFISFDERYPLLTTDRLLRFTADSVHNQHVTVKGDSALFLGSTELGFNYRDKVKLTPQRFTYSALMWAGDRLLLVQTTKPVDRVGCIQFRGIKVRPGLIPAGYTGVLQRIPDGIRKQVVEPIERQTGRGTFYPFHLNLQPTLHERLGAGCKDRLRVR